MRRAPHAAVQAGLWAMTPILDETGLLDAPSLLVMPLSAALAAVASRDWRWALAVPAAALALVLFGFSAWSVATARATAPEAVAFAAGMVPFHLLGTWLLVGLLWWPLRRARKNVQVAHRA